MSRFIVKLPLVVVFLLGFLSPISAGAIPTDPASCRLAIDTFMRDYKSFEKRVVNSTIIHHGHIPGDELAAFTYEAKQMAPFAEATQCSDTFKIPCHCKEARNFVNKMAGNPASSASSAVSASKGASTSIANGRVLRGEILREAQNHPYSDRNYDLNHGKPVSKAFANQAGKRWVGEHDLQPYLNKRGEQIGWINSKGTRAYRFPADKDRTGAFQANFERWGVDPRTINPKQKASIDMANGHLNVIR